MVDMNTFFQLVIVALAVVVSIVGVYYLRNYRVQKKDLQFVEFINGFVAKTLLTDDLAIKVSNIVGETIKMLEKQMGDATLDEKVDAAYALVSKSITAVGIVSGRVTEEELKYVIRLAFMYLSK